MPFLIWLILVIGGNLVAWGWIITTPVGMVVWFYGWSSLDRKFSFESAFIAVSAGLGGAMLNSHPESWWWAIGMLLIIGNLIAVVGYLHEAKFGPINHRPSGIDQKGRYIDTRV